MKTWDDNEVGEGKIIEGVASSPKAQNGFSEAKGVYGNYGVCLCMKSEEKSNVR